MTKKARSKGSAASDLVRRRNASRSGRVHGVCTAQRAVISPLFSPLFLGPKRAKPFSFQKEIKGTSLALLNTLCIALSPRSPPLFPPPPPCALLPPLHPSPPPAPFSLLLFFIFPVGVPRKRRRADRPPSRAGWGLGGVAQIGRPREQKRRKGGAQDRPPSRAGWGGGRSRERKRERRRAVPSARIGDRPICSVARGGPFSLSFSGLSLSSGESKRAEEKC